MTSLQTQVAALLLPTSLTLGGPRSELAVIYPLHDDAVAGIDERAGRGQCSVCSRRVGVCRFHDARLGKRLGSLLHQLGGNPGGTIPFACPGWANTRAAYRFLPHDDVNEQIRPPHLSIRPMDPGSVSRLRSLRW